MWFAQNPNETHKIELLCVNSNMIWDAIQTNSNKQDMIYIPLISLWNMEWIDFPWHQTLRSPP